VSRSLDHGLLTSEHSLLLGMATLSGVAQAPCPSAIIRKWFDLCMLWEARFRRGVCFIEGYERSFEVPCRWPSSIDSSELLAPVPWRTGDDGAITPEPPEEQACASLDRDGWPVIADE